MLFMHPLFLLAAAAVAGPILYHLLLRDRPRRNRLHTPRFRP